MTTTRTEATPHFRVLDVVVVLAVGWGLGTAGLADAIAELPHALGASDLVAQSLAWGAINATQLATGLLVVRHRCGQVWAPLKLRRPSRRLVAIGAGWGLAKMAVTTVLVFALPAAVTADGGGEGGYPAGPLLGQFTFALFFGAVMSPVYEEVLYRGVMTQAMASWWSPRLAIVLSAGLFAVAHLPRTFNTISAAIAALLFAWLLHRYQNLWVPIVAHAVSNGVLVLSAFAVLALE